MLFENKDRSYTGPIAYGESDFEYLGRSARVEAQRVRDFLEHWVSVYPESDREELISRLRCGDDRIFASAAFELALFAVLTLIGGQVTVHPELANGSRRRPDFLVKMPSNEFAYVEAVLASEHSEADLAARRRFETVLSAIEKVESPNFFLGISADGHPDAPPSGKRLRREVQHWLASLDPEVAAQELLDYGIDGLPRIELELDGWRISFEAIPKRLEARGTGGPIIGMLSGGARFVNVWEPIRNAIKAKGNRYGKLEHPLIVAINVDAVSVDRTNEMQALFGQEEYVFQRHDLSAPPRLRRKPNGAWFAGEGPQYTRVSGAWIFRGLSPWNMSSRQYNLYLNPWAARSVPTDFLSLPHAKADAEKMEWVEGCSLSDALGLSPRWPEE